MQKDTPRVLAVIAAGGSGTRFGNPGGKQLVDVAGKPLLRWSIEAFAQSSYVDALCVVCPVAEQSRMKPVLEGLDKPICFVESGAERQESTYNGILYACEGNFDIVAIHDGARPLIMTQTIDEAIEELLQHTEADGVICAHPAIDTLKQVNGDGVIVSTPDRSQYWCAQTPQVFWTSRISHAHKVAREKAYLGTDDASLIELIGGCVRVVKSPRDNTKVTVPEDLLPVTAIMQARLQERVN